MAKVFEIAERLQRKFKDVPGVDATDTLEWVEEAALALGYQADAEIDDRHVSIVLLYAQATGYDEIALNAAHYFKYTDAEEAVDKTMIAEQYRKLAQDLWTRYKREKAETPGFESSKGFTVMRRLDRPDPIRRRFW